jgi:hypothetical protein
MEEDGEQGAAAVVRAAAVAAGVKENVRSDGRMSSQQGVESTACVVQ